MRGSRKVVECEAGFACLQCGAKFATLQALGGHKSVHSNKRKAPPLSSSRKNSSPATQAAMAAALSGGSPDSPSQRPKRSRLSPDASQTNQGDTALQMQQWLRDFAAASLYRQTFNAAQQGISAGSGPSLATETLSTSQHLQLAAAAAAAAPGSTLAFSGAGASSLFGPDVSRRFASASTSLPSSVRAALADASMAAHQPSYHAAQSHGKRHSPEVLQGNGRFGVERSAGFFLEAAARRLRVMAHPCKVDAPVTSGPSARESECRLLSQKRHASASPVKPTVLPLMPALKKVDPSLSFDDETGSTTSSEEFHHDQILDMEGVTLGAKRGLNLLQLSSLVGIGMGTSNLLLALGRSSPSAVCPLEAESSFPPPLRNDMDLTLRLSL